MSLPPSDGPRPVNGSGSRASGKKRRKKRNEALKPQTATGTSTSESHSQATPRQVRVMISVPVASGKAGSKRVQQLKTMEYVDKAPVVTGAEAEGVYLKFLSTAESMAEVHGDRIELLYAKTACLCGLQRYDDALPLAEQYLEQAPEDHPQHGEACFWLGKILLGKRGVYSERIIQLFHTSYQLGFAAADRYYMESLTGQFTGMSVVKWFNPTLYVQCAERMHVRLSARISRLVEEDVRLAHLPEDSIERFASVIRLATQDGSLSDVSNDPMMDFTRLLCEFHAVQGDQRLAKTTEIKDLLSEMKLHGGRDAMLNILYYSYLRTSAADELRQEMFKQLSTKDNPLCRFFAAKHLELEKAGINSECIRLYKASFGILVGYEHLGEYYMAHNKFSDACETYKKAMEHVSRYLAGEDQFFGMKLGEQSEKLKASGQKIKKDQAFLESSAMDLQLQELDAAHHYLRHFQIKYELLKGILDEERARLAAIISHSRSTTTGSEPETESSDEKTTASGRSTDDELQVPAVIRSEEPDTGSYSVPAVTTSVKSKHESKATERKRRERTVGKSGLNPDRVIIQVREKITLQADFDGAEQDLELINPEILSYNWFRKRQLNCWIKFEKATNYDYLYSQARITGKAPEAGRQGLTYLCEAEKNIKKLIREIIKVIPAEQSTASPVASVTEDRSWLFDDMNKVMHLGEKLEAVDPSWRWQLGSLYSTLGHIQKALYENPANHRHPQYIQNGIRYYQFANKLRKRKLN